MRDRTKASLPVAFFILNRDHFDLTPVGRLLDHLLINTAAPFHRLYLGNHPLFLF